MDGRIGGEGKNARKHRLFGRVRRKLVQFAVDAILGASFHLVAHVNAACRILADQHNGQRRRHTAPRQGFGTRPPLRADVLGDGYAVDDSRRHCLL